MAGGQLTRALGELLVSARIAIADLQAMVVVRGPGSFTGMRVGLSAAKALAEATGVPLVGVSRLAVLSELGGVPLAALHAGRDRMFLRVGSMEELVPVAEAQARVGSEPVAVCEERLCSLFPQASLLREPGAGDALRSGFERVVAGDWDDAETLDALYLWREEEMLRAPAAVR